MFRTIGASKLVYIHNKKGHFHNKMGHFPEEMRYFHDEMRQQMGTSTIKRDIFIMKLEVQSSQSHPKMKTAVISFH